MLKQATNQNLEHLENALKQLTDEQFSCPLEILSNSTLGMHVRHILEFYICLIKATKEGNKVVDYDARKRDTSLELSTENCVKAIADISSFVDKIEEDVAMDLVVNYATKENEGCENMTINTSLYRELQYNIEHAVHHLAIIKIGIKSLEDNFCLDDDFGIAASTIRNNKNICAQ